MNLGTSRVAIKAAEEKRKKAQRREQLLAKIDEMKTSLEQEKETKAKLASKSEELRSRIARIEKTSEELLRTEKEFHAQRSQVKNRYDSRTKPIDGKGMLTFRAGTENQQLAGSTRPGRHTRRTAYTTNYNNEKIIGCGCEWVDTINRRDRVNKRMEEKEREEAESRAKTTTPGTTASAMERKRMYSSPLQDLGYMGKPSIIFQDIDMMKGYSLRRCRYYTDFCGNRIMMDPCDWPSQAGFVLTGL